MLLRWYSGHQPGSRQKESAPLSYLEIYFVSLMLCFVNLFYARLFLVFPTHGEMQSNILERQASLWPQLRVEASGSSAEGGCWGGVLRWTVWARIPARPLIMPPWHIVELLWTLASWDVQAFTVVVSLSRNWINLWAERRSGPSPESGFVLLLEGTYFFCAPGTYCILSLPLRPLWRSRAAAASVIPKEKSPFQSL